MKKASTLHQKAMALAEQGDAAKSAGDTDGARSLYEAAYEFERVAAMFFLRKLTVEPTRSVLFRSAASLAIDCKRFREAEQLLCQGLAGDPPPEIRVELRELYEQAHFQLFLEDSGLALAEGQVIVSMWGEQIAPGFVSCREVVKRLQKTEKLIYRTAERKNGMVFDDDSEPSEELRRNFKVYASLPLAASYAVVLRVAERERQLALPFSVDAAVVVSELLDCMELYNHANIEQLQGRISDPAYLRNFVSLARQLYPTTSEVSHVGFAGVTPNGERKVIELVKPPRVALKEPRTVAGHSDEGEPVRVAGILNFAKSSSRTRRIEIQNDHGIKCAIDVPEGMMADVVRPYFEAYVVADVTKYSDGTMRLEHINADDPMAGSTSS